jgi:hypothetical protein
MTIFKNILTAVLVIGIFALHPSLNKGETPITYLQYFVYGNSVKLSYNATINKDKIFVKWACEDKNLDCNELIIYDKGEKINEIPFERGNQKLEVYYNNMLIGTLNQNKLIRAQAHNYNIQLNSNAELITFKGEISGPSPATCSKTINKTDFTLANL